MRADDTATVVRCVLTLSHGGEVRAHLDTAMVVRCVLTLSHGGEVRADDTATVVRCVQHIVCSP